MAKTVIDIEKTARNLVDGSKITSIDGESVEYFFNGVMSRAHGGRFPPRLTGLAPVTITPYTGLTNGVPQFGAAFTVMAQVEEQLDKQVDPDAFSSRSKFSKETKGYLVVSAARIKGKRRGYYKIPYGDKANTQSYTDSHVVKFYAVTTTTDIRGAITGQTIANPITINPTYLRINDQNRTEEESGVNYTYGDAVIGIPMSQITQAQLINMQNYFTIETNGGPPIKYFCWDGQSITRQTHDYEVHLRRQST